MTDTPNLPAQVHERPTGTAIGAVRPASGTDALGAGDIKLPRMKVAQYGSKAVKRGHVPYGAVYVAHGQDDEEPTVLAENDGGIGELSEPVRIYILGVRPGYSYTDKNKDLKGGPGRDYPDLNDVEGSDPRNVQRVYDYTVVVPAYPDLPVQFLCKGLAGGQTAKTVNTRLKLAETKGLDSSQIAFKLQSKKVEHPKGDFAATIMAVEDVPAKDKAKDLELVAELAGLVGSGNVSVVEDVPTPQAPTPAPADAPDLD